MKTCCRLEISYCKGLREDNRYFLPDYTSRLGRNAKTVAVLEIHNILSSNQGHSQAPLGAAAPIFHRFFKPNLFFFKRHPVSVAEIEGGRGQLPPKATKNCINFLGETPDLLTCRVTAGLCPPPKNPSYAYAQSYLNYVKESNHHRLVFRIPACVAPFDVFGTGYVPLDRV